MGNCRSADYSSFNALDFIAPAKDSYRKDLCGLQEEFERKISIPLSVKVAHFTPSTFPVTPRISKNSQRFCQASWKLIAGKKGVDENGIEVDGLTEFYKSFYERLDKLDSNGKFEAVMTRYSSDRNKIAAKGSILLRVINFVLSFDTDDSVTRYAIVMLGSSHARKGIRPWQYSVLVQCLLQTIVSRLGNEASHEVMSAWVNVFGYILKLMLCTAIADEVVETEMFVNTATVFSSGSIYAQAQELEETKELTKKLRTGRSGMSTSRSGGAASTSSLGGRRGLPSARSAYEVN